jgi:hypothetical protein
VQVALFDLCFTDSTMAESVLRLFGDRHAVCRDSTIEVASDERAVALLERVPKWATTLRSREVVTLLRIHAAGFLAVFRRRIVAVGRARHCYRRQQHDENRPASHDFEANTGRQSYAAPGTASSPQVC